jgi:hypothetical protein
MDDLNTIVGILRRRARPGSARIFDCGVPRRGSRQGGDAQRRTAAGIIIRVILYCASFNGAQTAPLPMTRPSADTTTTCFEAGVSVRAIPLCTIAHRISGVNTAS